MIKWFAPANLLPLYAAAGTPEVWIVNLPEQQLEQYTEPATEGYRSIRIYRAGDILGTERFGRNAQTRRTSICRHEVMVGPKLLRRRYTLELDWIKGRLETGRLFGAS
jgi:hypothetical protein